MKKALSIISIAILVVAAIYFIPRFVLWNKISEVPYAKPAADISDPSLTDEKTHEYEQGDVIVQIPTYYKIYEIKEYSSIMCEATAKNKELIIVYDPFEQVANKFMPGFSEKYKQLLGNYEAAAPEFPTSLIYEDPEDLYELMKDVYTADKNDYNFWNLKDALRLNLLLKVREESDKSGYTFSYLYEREDICAVICEYPESPGSYIALIFQRGHYDNVFAFIIKTSDMDDVTKLLNGYEITRSIIG